MAISGRRAAMAGVAVLVIGAAGYGLFRPSSQSVGPRIGQSAPEFIAPSVTGGARLALTAERGKTVLLNFWASWCVPCQAEFPILKRAESRHPGVVVVGVVFNDSAGAAAGFMRSQHADWTSVEDPSARIASAYGVGNKPGIPDTFVIDSAGTVRAVHYGGFGSDSELDTTLEQAGVLA
jgi:cytochrome c biogenesis protein CcmG/thiol:disulfide interchange protein DsbE